MAEFTKSKSELTLLPDSSNSGQCSMDDDANVSAQSSSNKFKKSLAPANRRLSKALSAWSLTLPSHKKQKPDKSESYEKRRLSSTNDGSVVTNLHSTSFSAAEIVPKISQDSSEPNKNRPLPPTPDKSSPSLENNATLATQQFISTSSSHSKNTSNESLVDGNPSQSTCEQNALISTMDNALVPSKHPDTQSLLFPGVNSTDLCKSTETEGVHLPETEVNFIVESTQNVAIDQGQKLQTKILPATECSFAAAASTSDPQPNYIPTPDKSATTNDDIGNNTVYLGDALQTYAECFPMRIKVILGYCMEDSEYNLSTNDVYDIHFIKESHIITLKDADGSTQYVPLESAMMLGLLFNPSSDYDKALCGHKFEKCSDIMALTQMPKVICVTSPVVSPDPQNSIQRHEVLAVIGTLKFKIGGKRCLRVYSFLENKEKLLTEACAGYFTTKPSMLFLHLQQILQKVNHPFPSQALLYQEKESVAKESLQASPSSIVTLCDSTTEKSLVASPVIDGSADNNYRFNVPLNQGIEQIEIEVISWNELMEPNNIYDDTVRPTKPTSPQYANIHGSHNPEDTYATVGLGIPKEKRVVQMPTIEEYAAVPAEIDNIGSRQVEKQKSSIDRIETEMEDIKSRLTLLELQVQTQSNQQKFQDLSITSTTSDTETECNKKYLATLNETEIEQLLISMDLKQYTLTFKSEHINGDILIECDDDVLRVELGVSSKLHRLRLLKVIKGEYSCKTFLKECI